MANLKEIRTRIASVTSTRQITSAMKMVSAAKLKKAQDAVTQMRPYADKLHTILQNLSGSLDAAEDNKYAVSGKSDRVLFVLIASNRGLCGAFNSNVAKMALHLTENDYKAQFEAGNIDFISVGKKTADTLKSRGIKTTEIHEAIFNDLSFENASEIATGFMSDFEAAKYSEIRFIYNSFKNAGVQILKNEQFLPIEMNADADSTQQSDYIFEPNQEDIVEQLIPMSLKTQFFKTYWIHLLLSTVIV